MSVILKIDTNIKIGYFDQLEFCMIKQNLLKCLGAEQQLLHQT